MLTASQDMGVIPSPFTEDVTFFFSAEEKGRLLTMHPAVAGAACTSTFAGWSANILQQKQ